MERLNKIARFISVNYCQSCKKNYEDECNSEEVSEKHESYVLEYSQIKETNLFDFFQNKCRNYLLAEGYPRMLYVVNIHYKTGKIEKIEWLSAKEISEIWKNENVEDVDIIFSDL